MLLAGAQVFFIIIFKFIRIYRIVHSNYDCTENICFFRVFPQKVITNYFDKKFKISEN